MKNLKNRVKSINGITLVALVITIIVLLILAGITISQLQDNGLFEKSKLAKEKAQNAQELENSILGDYENEISSYFIGGPRADGSSHPNYIIGQNNRNNGTEAFTIEKDSDNAYIFTGQVSLQYSINSTENFKSVSALGSVTDGRGFHYAKIDENLKKGDIVYLKRDTSSIFGYVIVY